VVTPDLGGTAGTQAMSQAIADAIGAAERTPVAAS
jgi:hypothetical protein